LTAPLVLKPKTLGEIVVKGTRPVLSYNHGNITVDVANSYLKDDVSLESILGKLPGVVVNDGVIRIFGKNKLRIYINNMEMRSQDEIKSLQPTDIDKIEIIRNVGAEYDADVDAIIKIRIRKKRNEKVSISLSENLSIAHYLYNGANLSLYIGHNEKFSQYITLNGGFGKPAVSHTLSYLYTYFDNYTNRNCRDDYTNSKSENNGLFYSVNYAISKNKEFEIQYGGNFSGVKRNIDGTRFYDDGTSSKTIDLDSEETIKSNQSIINLSYMQKINGANELSVIADYVIRGVYATTDITESSTYWKANNVIATDNGGKVFSITPEYKITGEKFKYNFGLKYSYLVGNSENEFRPSMNIDRNQVSEYTGGVYLLFGANLSSVDIKSGLRMEYTNSGIQSDNDLNNINRDYFNLIPHISINMKPYEHLSLTAYYRRTISRPNIGSLSSTIIYRDSLHYMTGNPYLKPYIIDNFNFNASFHKFNLSFGYGISGNVRQSVYIPDNSNPNRIIGTVVNINEKRTNFGLEISYSFNHPVFNSMISLNCHKMLNGSMLFRNEMLTFNKPAYFFRTSGNVKILKNTSLDYSFFYSSSGDGYYLRYKSYSNLISTVTQYLMDGKLMISFSVEDIFDKNKGNRYTQYSNDNVVYIQDALSPDSRRAICRIIYKWGVNKSIRKKTSDTDHINRL
jgi:hypothetical protein